MKEGFIKLIKRFFGERTEIINVEKAEGDYFVTVKIDRGFKGEKHERFETESLCADLDD